MPPLKSKSKSKPRVLLVDDDDKLRQLHSVMLAEEGYAVSQATNGLEAVTLCQLHGFDLVIVELHLQGKDNLWIIENLREQSRASKFIGTARFGSLQPDYCRRMARHLGAYRMKVEEVGPETVVFT